MSRHVARPAWWGPGNPTAQKRRANRLLRDRLRSRDESALRIAFFCECDDAGCSQPVWLDGREFEGASEDPDWVALVAGHTVRSAVPVALAG
jgi:hypothetical protein